MEWPLIGRDSVLRRLTAALSRDGVQGIDLVGEAGIGKSRLVAALARGAAADGRAVESASATAATSGIPYGALAHLLPPPGPDGHGALEPAAMVRELADRRSDGLPFVLVVDDAHYLDSHSSNLLALAASQGHAFVILTRRSREPLPDPLRELWAGSATEHMEIGPLDERACAQLVARALDGPVDPLTLSALWRRSRGNPLFLRELVISALESGALQHEDSAWRLSGELTPSDRLVELVEARLGQLTDDERDVVELLAAAGSIGVGVLERLAPHAVLERLEVRRLVEVTRHGNRQVCRLSHPLYAEAVRTSVPRVRLRRLMQRLADALESTGLRRREDLMRVAVWQLEGGGASHPRTLLAGAHRALASFDAPLAERLARAAMAGGQVEVAASIVLGESLAAQQRVREADVVLRAAGELAREDEEIARVALARANLLYFRAGQSQLATAVLRDASRALGDGAWRAELDSLLALFQAQAGDLIDVAEAGRRLLAFEGSRPRAVVHALMYSSIANVMLGRIGEAEDQVATGSRLALATRDDLPMAGPMLAINGVMAAAYGGRIGEAVELARAGYAGALAAGIPELSAMWAMNLAECLLLAGDIEESLTAMYDSLAVVRERDPFSVHGINCGVAAVCAVWLGRTDEARALHQEIVDGGLAKDVRSRIWRDRAAAWIAWLDDGAEVAARRALDAGRRAMADTHLVWAAWLFHDAARLGLAAPAARRLAALATRVEGSLVACMAAQARALALGDSVGLERAASAFEQMGSRLFAAEAAALSHREYLAQGRTRLARIAAGRSALLAAQCGALQTPPLADAAPMPLTARELEIARMAAGGMPSRAVADRLGISVRTVDNHLGAIYGKLGVAGRRELRAVLGIGAVGAAGGDTPALN